MNTIKINRGIGAALLAVFVGTGSHPVFAQEDSEQEESVGVTLEEIIVTGRKREESLLDVPVSISVLSSDLIAQENVITLFDLSELVPGLNYNYGNVDNGNLSDRLSEQPSIRGVGSSGGSAVSTKVSSFIDGMPVLGSAGAINIGGATQVEVYNGPQSAAFGRSTFGGAINYVTRDPGDEIAGSVGVNWSNTGTRIISGNVGGPIIADTLGFQLGVNYEDSTSEDASLYSFSDGVEANTRGGKNVAARFVWTPTDNFKAKLTFSNDKTDDGPASDNFYATQASARECFDSLNTFTYWSSGMRGPSENLGVDGYFDCELDIDRTAQPLRLHDINRYFDQNPAEFDAVVQDLIAQGADDVYTQAEIEDAVRTIATIYSVPQDEAGTQIDRDRIYAQFEYMLDNGSLFQFSVMNTSEESDRQYMTAEETVPFDYLWNATDQLFEYDIDNRAGSSSDVAIDEEYYELRWASPADSRIRYLAGAALYKYDYSSDVYRQAGFQAVFRGIEDEALALTGEVIDPGTQFASFTENYAAFFNVSYDFTENLTGSFEGRYAEDEVGTYDTTDPSAAPDTNTFKSFTPRIALNYNLNESTSLYAQYAVGISPGGLNADLFNDDIRDALDNGIPVATDPVIIADGATEVDLNDPSTYTGTPVDLDDPSTYTREVFATFDSDRYDDYDEETLTNYEFGFKGSAFDGRLTYTGALYHMIWEGEVQTFNIDWAHPYANDDRIGQTIDAEDTVAGVTPLVYVETAPDEYETTARVSGNTGDTETTGIELQGNWRFSDNWSISGNTSLMRVKYTDFCDFDLWTGIEGVQDGGAVAGLTQGVDEHGNSCYQLKGQDVEREPSLTASLSPSYRTEIGGIGINASTRFQYTGESYLDNLNFTKAPATFRVNLTLGLTKDNWSGNFYIQNLLDDKTITSASRVSVEDFQETYPDNTIDPSLNFTALDTEYATYSYRPPSGRTFGFRMNYRF